MQISLPELRQSCVTKPISLPSVVCEDIRENKCVMVPEVEEVTESVEDCRTEVGEDCREAELELPRHSCRNGLEGELEKPPRL